ncbi:hypothetical protein EDC02_1841 [Micromonospora sp. Llam0]|nr:hypothetical protein EDC02_1841 [Micromonospora sp. Llam0]
MIIIHDMAVTCFYALDCTEIRVPVGRGDLVKMPLFDGYFSHFRDGWHYPMWMPNVEQ